MPRTFGRTHEEIRADGIASRLVEAINSIETFNGDPNLILQAAKLMTLDKRQGTREAIFALYKYYNEGA
jgi:hypothetical protein